MATGASPAPPPDGALPPRRQVVTAWVQRADGRVAVVQRSGEVNSYQYKWGGISGGVEGDEPLLLRCLLEIEEEVGIPRDRLQVVRAGRPQLVGDGARRFAVHPFLFTLEGTDVPPFTLNWESVDARWVSLEELQTLDVVPDLAETLRRVLVSPEEQAWLDRFLHDRSHGAAQMVSWVLDSVEEWGTKRVESPGDLSALQNYAWHLACVRPSMASVAVAAAAVVSRVLRRVQAAASGASGSEGGGTMLEGCSTSESVGAAVVQVVQALRDERAEVGRKLVANAVQQLLQYDSVITLSLSSTLREALAERAHRKPLACTVCESRPLFEGVAMAEAVREAGAAVTLITDAQAGLGLAAAQAALVGADAMTPSGLVNKVGTWPLAVGAQHLGRPVFGIADSWKVSPGPVAKIGHPQALVLGGEGEDKPASEVTAAWLSAGLAFSSEQEGIRVRNTYFESTPLALFTGVITEAGLLRQEDVVALEKERWAEAVEAFGLEPLTSSTAATIDH